MFGSRNFLFARSAGASGTGLWSWGNNSYGQLGLGNTTSYSSPKQVGALFDWGYPAISGVTNHSVLCNKTDGTLWAWGNGSNGGLGTGNDISRSSPVQVGALTTWGRPSAIRNYSAACVKTDGTLWAWGYNASGVLGQNNTISRSSPVQIGALTTWSKLTTTTQVASLLCTKTDGTLWSWGANAYGQLGQGNIVSLSSPVQIGALTDWVTPALGFHALCVKTNGTLWAWGANFAGELGLGDTINRSSPVQIGALTTWSKPSGGNLASACVKTDGTLWMWGYNGFGQLGQNNTINRSSPVQVGSLTTWSYVKNGWNPTVGVTTDGTLFTWGLNTFGQLGLGDTINRSSPVQVGSSITWKNPTVARTTMLCTKQAPTSAPSNASVPVVTGTAQEGEILTSTTGTWNNDPTSFAYQWQRGTSNIGGATSSTYTVVTADVGSTLRCVVTATNAVGATAANSANTAIVIAYVGKLFSWGQNNYGALGLGDAGFYTSRSSPVQVGAETQWAKRATAFFTLAVKTTGQLWSWGYNSSGQLGLGNRTNYSSPIQVGALTNWATPGLSGSGTSLCVKTDGTLWSWGANYQGQLGHGNTTYRSSPVQVGALTNWSTPSIGDSNQFVLCSKTDGTLWAWGRGNYGVLGLGDTTNRSSPVQVGALTNWSTPVVGSNFTICSKTDGTLWAWGDGSYGKLGKGNTTNYSSPVQIGALTNWKTPVAGNNFGSCLKTDGTLWAWGVGTNGQLGQNNTANRSSPVQIGSLTDWKTPAGGTGCIVCAKTDGTLWAWGRNDTGALGLGDSVNKSSPVQVGSLTTWLVPAVAARSVTCTQR